MSRAVIFDCDGVLADTERDGHLAAFNRLFAEVGLETRWSEEEYRRLLQIAGGKERLLSLFTDASWVARSGLPTERAEQERLVAAWHRRKTRIFLELVTEGALPGRPGVARLAAEARDAGWQVAVASTAADESVRAIVEHVFPPGVAERVRVFAGDVVRRKKPAADVYLLALRRLGRSPQEVCVIEDSGQGLLAARRAGCAAVITVSAFTAADDFSGAALVVDGLGDAAHPLRVLAAAVPPPGRMVTLATCEQVMAWGAARDGAGQHGSSGARERSDGSIRIREATAAYEEEEEPE